VPALGRSVTARVRLPCFGDTVYPEPSRPFVPRRTDRRLTSGKPNHELPIEALPDQLVLKRPVMRSPNVRRAARPFEKEEV
jgi:hypothetical protein